MNAPSPSDEPLERSDADLNSALISELGLSDLVVQKIHEIVQSTGDSFADAAVRLGILRPEVIEKAVRKIRGGDETSMFETAIRRISSDRRIVLRQAEQVEPSRELIIAHEPDNPRSERLKALRTELLLLHEAGRGANMVAVLSAEPGEGRSLLCAELAISFAQLGRRTLLVDTDMRKPRQQALFGSANLQGLSQALAQNHKPYFHPVGGLPLLHLLPAGPLPPNPLELLSDGRFSNLLTDWRNAYEFIVLDTPPVGPFADGLAVATMSMQALVVSRAQHTTYKSTQNLMRRLGSTHARILGAVINHF